MSDGQGIMIDRDGTPDRDDAIWAEAVDDGWELSVHIACVADAVPAGSAVDQRAARQAQSIYRRESTIAMLPRSTGAATTLTAADERPAVRVAWHVAADGTAGGARVSEGRLRRGVAMDYAAATAAIADPAHPQHQALAAAHGAARTLLARRRAEGALAIYDLIRGWASDGDGGLRQLAAAERHASYMVVSEFMVCANTLIAGFCVNADIPIMFRNHEAAAAAPPRERLMDELRLAVADGGEDWLGETARLKLGHLLRPAVYAVHASGHYGLRLPWYCHATSPLRRYPDLVTQRQLLAVLRDKRPPHSAGEVEQLAQSVNDVIRERRERSGEWHKERAKTQRRAELADGAYRDLDADQFHRLLKLAVKEQVHSPGLAAELQRRIAADALLARDAYPVLITDGPEWKASRAALTGWLAQHPEHAVSLAAIHARNLGMDAPLWEEGHVGTVQEPLFSARTGLATDGKVDWSAVKVARRKDTARQMAALSLIAGLAGQPDPAPPGPMPAASRPAAGQALDAEGRNPVMVLSELGQAGVLLALDYAYAESGPSHSPEFTCTVTARHAPSGRAVDADATAKTKKDAKTAAARRLWEAVTAVANSAALPPRPRAREKAPPTAPEGDSRRRRRNSPSRAALRGADYSPGAGALPSMGAKSARSLARSASASVFSCGSADTSRALSPVSNSVRSGSAWAISASASRSAFLASSATSWSSASASPSILDHTASSLAFSAANMMVPFCGG